jgi:hypothetical protein
MDLGPLGSFKSQKKEKGIGQKGNWPDQKGNCLSGFTFF